MVTKTLKIEGMSCGHCVRHVKDALVKLDGVVSAEVDLDSKTAILEASDEISDEAIKTAVDEAGYKVAGIITKA